MIIYKVTNNINGKVYIGQTIHSLEVRKSGHIRSILHKDDGMYFHRALRIYGIDNFTWTILHDNIITMDFLNRLEIFYIGYYDTFGRGYNLNAGGNNAAHSEKTKKKISYRTKGKNNPNYGKKHSVEIRKKISESKKGKNNPMYGRTGKDSPLYGRKLSVGQKKKISDNSPRLSGKNHSMARAVIIKNKFFDTCKEASEFNRIPASTIRYRIKRQIDTHQYA